MSEDIVARLRGWFKAVDAVPASDLMDEAADEIERLRGTVKRDDDFEARLKALEHWKDGFYDV